MRKLTLDCDALRVDSFETSPERAHKTGTVRGHAEAGIFWTVVREITKTQVSVQGYNSCDPDVFTCGDTCGDRCHTLPATCMTCTLDVCCPQQTGDGGL
ncbi:MAG TPA: hypothetical protein VF092_18155 [Longimicrobium sp.]